MAERAPLSTSQSLAPLRRVAGELVLAASRHQRFLLLSPALLFSLSFFLFPFLSLFRISLAANPGGTGYGEGTAFYIPGTWTLENYYTFFSDPYFLDIALFTIQFGIAVSVITTLVSYAFAYQIYRAGPVLKTALILIVVLPKFTNVLVLMYGLLVMFGLEGLVNKVLLFIGVIDEPLRMLYNLFSVLLGEVVLVMPYCALVMVAVLHAIDGSLLEAAEGLGASRARAFWEVTLPLSMPGVWVSVLLSFMWGIGAFVSPYLLGTADLYTLSVEVDQQVNWRLNWAMGATIAFVLLGIIAALMIVLGRIQHEEAQA